MIDMKKFNNVVRSGKFFGITFRKNSGEITKRNCKGIVKKFLAGGERTVPDDYVILTDRAKFETGHPFISVRPENIMRIKCGNIELNNLI